MCVVYKHDELLSFSLEESFYNLMLLVCLITIREYSFQILYFFVPFLFGQVGLRTIWEKYYEEAHAIIYVIDASSPNSFEDAKSALGWLCVSLK